MHKSLNCLLNVSILMGCTLLLSSCGTTDLTGFPPVAVTGTIDGKPIRVVYYPDKSKPTEIIYAGGLDQPIEINLDK